MEVREAIDNIKYYINFYKDNFITENQKLAMVFNQLEYENKLNLLEYEKEKIVDLLKSLEAENKGMWKEIKRKSIYERLKLEEDKEMMFLGAYILKWKNGNCPEPECGFTECNFEILEQKYLGGRE